MKITCLGTGSPESHARRASSGYLVEIGTDKILLDCGGGVVSRLIEAGYRPSDITHLFFTHLHSDHMMDYARLVHAAWDEGKIDMAVWGPAPIAEITNKLFGAQGVFATDLRARTELQGSLDVWTARGGSLPRPWPHPQIIEIENGFSFAGNGWRLSTAPALHAQPLLESLAFRIDTDSDLGGKSFVYSGDAALSGEMSQLCQSADLLIHWCYRLAQETQFAFITEKSPCAGEIAEMAQKAGVKHLLLSHIRKHMDEGQHHADMLAEAKAQFSGQLAIAEDLQQITL